MTHRIARVAAFVVLWFLVVFPPILPEFWQHGAYYMSLAYLGLYAACGPE